LREKRKEGVVREADIIEEGGADLAGGVGKSPEKL